MHAGYLNIEDQKMSKSLGNVRTVRQLIEEHDPFDLRFLILSAHYRSPLNFSAELVAQSRAGRQRMQEMITNMFIALGNAGDISGEHEQKLQVALEETQNRFVEAMDDDFNTADGLGVLFDLARSSNIYLKEGFPYSRELLEEVLQFFREVNDVFEIIEISAPETLDEEITAMISRRDEARAAKDWAAADRIRDELLAWDIILEDTPHGTRWKRK
jgi:cysteinyl-tRNA synthetase